MKHFTEEQKKKLMRSFEEKSHAEFLNDFRKELSKNGFYDEFME